MDIKHDKEIFNELILDLKEQQDNLEDIKDKVENLFDLILPLNIDGCRTLLKEAADNLEDKLSFDFANELDEFIDRLDEINETFEQEDINIKNKLEGR